MDDQKLNDLELALLDPGNGPLDLYLEVAPTKQIRADIEQIRRRAATSTPAGVLRERVLQALGRLHRQTP
jgi:hypothetical protein